MAADRQAVRPALKRAGALAVVLAVAAVGPAAASPRVAFDIPAGTLGQALAALGRQAGVDIGTSDIGLPSRRVGALRAKASVRDALARLLLGSGAKARQVAPGVWRIEVRRSPAPATAPAPAPARAPRPAESAAPALEEVVVTASKDAAPLMNFPGDVSVLAPARFDPDKAPRSTEALEARIASLGSTHLGAGRNKLFIRGIADSSFNGPNPATVGQYFGDTRLTYNAPDPNLDLYDIESIEVLEGPQGALYGAGSLGGVIRINRNPPRLDDTEAETSVGGAVTAHGQPDGDVAGMMNLPLASDRLAVRAVAYAIGAGGYIDDTARRRDDVNSTSTRGGRVAVREVTGDGWTIDLNGTAQAIDGADSQSADLDAPRLTRASAVAQPYRTSYGLVDLVVSRHWGDLQFTSSSGLSRQYLAENYDATQPDGPPMTEREQNRTRLFSTESRLSRESADGLGWVVGSSLLVNQVRLTRSSLAAGVVQPQASVGDDATEATLYGEGAVRLPLGLTMRAGARLTVARLSGTAAAMGGDFEITEVAAEAARTESRLLPSLAISARPRPDLLLFLRYQQGFRPGGVSVASGAVAMYDPDRMSTVEAGARWASPDGRAELSAVAAYSRWSDIQADLVTDGGAPILENIGDGRIYSFELKGGWRPARGLQVNGGVFLNADRLTNPAITIIIVTQSSLPNVARLGATAGADYHTRLGEDLDLGLWANMRYVGASHLGVGPVLEATQGDYVEAELGARVGNAHGGLSLTISNPLDTLGNRFALGTPFRLYAPQTTPLQPRTIRLGLDARF